MYHPANVTRPFPSWYPMCRSDFKDVFTSKKDYAVIYGRETNFKRRNGTGFILDKDARKNLIGFETVTVRISK